MTVCLNRAKVALKYKSAIEFLKDAGSLNRAKVALKS